MSTPSMESVVCPMGIMGTPKVETIGSPSMMSVLCLMGIMGSPEVGTIRSPSVLMVLCPCVSIITAVVGKLTVEDKDS